MSNLRITGIDIRNFRKIAAMSLRFDDGGNLVTIGGENANGKTSALDALEAALTPGVSLGPDVRHGQDGLGIRVHIPPYTIKKTYGPKGPSLDITMDSGVGDNRVANGAQFLKSLLGGMFVDPVAFMDAEPRDQRKILSEIVGLDVTQYDAAIETAKAAFDRLQDRQTELVARANALPWYEDAPEQPISAAEIQAEMQRIAEHNAGVGQIFSQLQTAGVVLAEREMRVSRTEARILEIQAQLDAAKAELEVAKTAVAEQKVAIANLNSAAQSAERIDPAETETKLAELEATNTKVRENQLKIAANAEWERAEVELAAAKAALDKANAEKKAALSKVKFPVPGLGFDAKGITYNGQPFALASHAEQIRASVAISLAQRGQVAPIIIRDASTIDAKMLKVIADEAAERGAQVFAEVIANFDDEDGQFDRTCTVYLADGAVVTRQGQPLEGQPTAQPSLTEEVSH